MLKWVILWSLWATRLVRQPTEPIRVSNGLLRGSVSHDGGYIHYLSIPYATVTEETRFKAAGPEPKWKGVFEAIDENLCCPHTVFKRLIGDEDCLFLNVYTPINSPRDAKLPVMVFIHGGAFFRGSSRRFLYGPKNIVEKDVILVTVNYRLNIQGFLCLGIEEAPGNAGMKDQVLALKWIQKNIKAFGGDPDHVTIFGESAGGASISYHLISPMSKGLFHKAIIQSGSSLSPWALEYKPLYKAWQLANVMGYDTKDPYELFDIFKNYSTEKLIRTRVPRVKHDQLISELLFVPCIENVIEGVEPFLTEAPYDVLTKGTFNKVPVMIGSNDAEGVFFVADENKTTIAEMTFYGAMPRNLVFPNDEVKRNIADNIEKFVMGDDVISPETMEKLSKFIGDPNFGYPVTEEADLLSKKNDGPVYSYLFKYDGRRNIPKYVSGAPYRNMPGAVHADELMYLFNQPILGSLTMFETNMIQRMTTLWTNFAKYGDPTPELSPLLPIKWRPVDYSSPRNFIIDDEMGDAPLWTPEMKFWRDIYDKYRRIH